MSNLSELKKLHDKGMALIYLREKEKRPIDMGWTSRARASWDELQASHNKKYNVGVRLGEPSLLTSGMYLGAIDCDVKAQSRKAKLEMNEKLRELGIDLDTAPIVMSGRGNGSKHVYVQTRVPMSPMKYAQSEILVKVKMNEKRPHSKREMEQLTDEEREQGYRLRPAWEIAFMGTGQQTVLPPSIHPDTGFAYDWANPLMVKYLPTFDPSKFVSQTTKKLEERELDFKAVDVKLWESSLKVRVIRLIEDGTGSEDRSADLFSVTMSMCRAGFTDNQILSVLSNPDHWISSAAYEHTQSTSRARAVKWLNKYTLTKARYETHIMRRFDNPPEVIEPLTKKDERTLDKQLQEIQDKTLPDLDGNSKPKPSQRNVLHILEIFLGGGLVGYDEFSNRAVFLKDTEYGGKRGQELTDLDDLHLKAFIAAKYRFEPSKELCYEAHTIVASRHRFNPVRDYLDSLEWDGKERLDEWLVTAFGAVGPEEYVHAISRKTLVGAVARIYEPGCKFDYAMVLEGLQGKGKSTVLRILTGDKWFTDGLGDIFQKDVVDQMTGKWIIELGELASIKKTEVTATKAFISRQVDRVRMAYGRRSADYPRQSIFIGSTNDDEYFTDETGNRRFWPVSVDKANIKWVKANRDQLWAEAKTRYELGEDLFLPEHLEAIAAKEQSKRYVTDEWENEIKKVLHTSHNNGEDVKTTATNIFCELNGMPVGSAHPTQYEATRIGKILRRLGFKRQSVRIDGLVHKGWVRHGSL